MDNITSFEEHLKIARGKIGAKRRTKFDAESLAFRLGAMLKEAGS